MPRRSITDTPFSAWRRAAGFETIEAGGGALGLSRSRAGELETGRSRKDGAPVRPTLCQRLAMAALAAKLEPWPDD